MSLVQMYHTNEMPNITKSEAFKNLKTYDYALPQEWLNDFVKFSKLDYGFVLSTTVWCYDNNFFGEPVTCSIQVYEKIKDYQNF